MQHGLSEQDLHSYEEMKIQLDEWLTLKYEKFFWREIHYWMDQLEKGIANDANTLIIKFIHFIMEIKVYILRKHLLFVSFNVELFLWYGMFRKEI